MDNVLAIVTTGTIINIVVVAFGYGMLWQKVNTVCKTFDDHTKQHPACIFHNQVRTDVDTAKAEIANIKERLKGGQA